MKTPQRIFVMMAIFMAWLPLPSREQTARPKITGIAHVRFYAADLVASRQFYQHLLGLGGGVAGCMGITQTCFTVNSHQELELAQIAGGAPDNLVAEVAFATENVGQMHEYLTGREVAAGAISKGANGLEHFEVKDPEGHTISFVKATEAFFSPGDAQISARILHAGFIVKDRVAEDRFYRGVLGFRPYWHGGMKDDQTDWVSLQVPDGAEWLEFMVNVGPNADKHTRGVMNHVAMGVPDIHVAAKRLLSKGMKVGEEPKMGRDGKWQLNLYDPDQTRVELMEFAPVEKPCCSEYTGSHPKP
jgi:catechol 2,3-dioxygenase-like lactoylglutathione lyase family enzyme